MDGGAGELDQCAQNLLFQKIFPRGPCNKYEGEIIEQRWMLRYLGVCFVVCFFEPSGLAVKNPHAKAGDMSSVPGSRRFPGEGNGNSLQYSCLGNLWTEEPSGL